MSNSAMLPGERLNAALAKNVSHRNEVPLKQKRLDLIIAFNKLGVDKYSFCDFLKDHIELEEQFLLQYQGVLSPQELMQREKGLMDAKLMQFVLSNF